jgi:hypothetical protein
MFQKINSPTATPFPAKKSPFSKFHLRTSFHFNLPSTSSILFLLLLLIFLDYIWLFILLKKLKIIIYIIMNNQI